MKKLYAALAFVISLLTAHAQIRLGAQPAIRLWPDSLHAPFIFGVTSGDPTDSSVIIWSAIPIDSTGAAHQLGWQLATDSTFATVLQSGTITVDNVSAYAGQADIHGLQAFTRYCYRFSSGGSYSATGYTQTAPDQAPDSLSFALVSCSSLYSGYFNSYRQIANNPGINAIIHVGDFIYDFIDPQERVRLPQPEPVEPLSLAEWRDRYRLYLLDPDLREARRRKPWLQMWDNHDVNKDNDSSIRICTRAYFEFSPVRRPSATDSLRIWRKLAYGPTADVMIIDDWIYAGNDTFPDGNKKMLPDDQYDWLMDQLDSSAAQWKIVPMSKLFSHWALSGVQLPGGGLDNEWEGYPECRDSLLSNISSHHVNNSVFVSGDLHINNVDDLALNPFDSTQYNGTTGRGGLGVEVNGISISRGNFDESGIPQYLGPGLYAQSLLLNPHQRYLNFFDNGYVIMTFNSDSMISRMMICPILYVTDSQRTDATLICRNNDNHWLRADTAGRSTGLKGAAGYAPFAVYPNPSADGLWLLRAGTALMGAVVEVTNDQGQVVYHSTLSNPDSRLQFDSPGGVYLLRVSNGADSYTAKLVRLGSYW